MIKEALQYVIGLSSPTVREINGSTYTDKPLTRVAPYIPRAQECTKMTSLTSFVDYIKARVERDGDYEYKNLYILIESSTKVTCFEKDNSLDGRKTYICSAEAEIPTMDFGYFYDAENFNIMLQSRFCDTEHKKMLLSIIGNVRSSNVETKDDDGITQTVMTRRGILTKEGTSLPNPVTLSPFRSFVEIEQTASPFIFRAKESKVYDPKDKDAKEIQFALFEADGGAWKMNARDLIKKYLEYQFILNDNEDELVIFS